MKLLLTSIGWWKSPSIGDALIKMINKKASEVKVLIVITPDKFYQRNKYIIRQIKQFGSLSIPEKNIGFLQLDRRVAPDDIQDIDVLLVFGGNTYEYLDRFRKTGMDKLIRSFVANGGIYVGVSAGSYVVCPTIEAAGWKHADRNIVGLKDLTGLGLVPYLITAHYVEELQPVISKAAEKSGYEVVALTDKQAILVEDSRTEILGTGKKNIFNQQEDGALS